MKRLAVFIGILIFLSFGNGASATFYTGSEGNLTSGLPTVTRIDVGGIGGQGNAWLGIRTGGALRENQGVHLEWSVDDTTNANYWTYTYTFTVGPEVNNKSVASFDLSFGGSPSVDIFSQNLRGYTNYTASGTGTILASQGVLGNYAPGPGTITGLDWAFPGGTSSGYYSFSLSLVTKNAPDWGDFTIMGPGTAGSQLKVWNLGLADDYPELAFVSGYDYDGYEYVMTPGAAAAPVPIPGAIFLLAPGLAGIVAIRRRLQS